MNCKFYFIFFPSTNISRCFFFVNLPKHFSSLRYVCRTFSRDDGNEICFVCFFCVDRLRYDAREINRMELTINGQQRKYNKILQSIAQFNHIRNCVVVFAKRMKDQTQSPNTITNRWLRKSKNTHPEQKCVHPEIRSSSHRIVVEWKVKRNKSPTTRDNRQIYFYKVNAQSEQLRARQI
jgi:hypothetical protein